ncbi:glycosyltransferase family 2 protein [Leptospira bandrabouensis]|uniref:Glycosyltransferase n=1 Tax=Leptospira bandrabouensis TaxID=2484903 RepID=A0A6H3NLL3_9LEPT|nr:glycosyltransferase [Leptospira bandrabouensis]TGN03749.1 glycosyltransferase [Leptospira bandrabouensis]TGN12226.1 glycosyltransferase [Leptospira bandrabouensis]
MKKTNLGTPTPLVSILMNCYNGAEFLREAIDSVIAQTYQNWELVFWDNQSTDKSAEIVRSYNDSRIKYYYAPEHTKLYKGRNLAIEKVTGNYIAFLDTDDVWKINKLELQMSAFANSDYDLVCSNYDLIDPKSRFIKRANRFNKPSGFITKYLIDEYYIGILTVVFNAKLLKENNLNFNQSYNHIGDFELFLKLSENHKILYMSNSLACYRIHDNNLSSKKELELLREIKKMIREISSRDFYSRNLNLISKLKLVRQFMLLKLVIRKGKPVKIGNFFRFLSYDLVKFVKLLILFFVYKVKK